MQAELGKCEHIVISSTKFWEPMIVKLGKVASLNSGSGTIYIDDGSYAYLNTEQDGAILHSMKLVLVGLDRMLS